MYRPLAAAVLLLVLSAGPARAVSPVVVDRESLQLQLQGLASQVANLQDQVNAAASDPGRLAYVVSQLQTLHHQLRTMSRLLASAPVARGAGGIALRFPALIEAPPPPPAYPQQPPPPAVPPPIDDAALASALERIDHESFENDKLRIVRDLASSNYFLVAQVERVLPHFSFENTKVKIVEMLAPRILDRQNGYRLYSSFSFSSNKERVEKLLAR